MNPASCYFVRVGAEVRGPYDVARLRQLAEVDVIAPGSEGARAAEGPWFKLETLAEAPVIFPPRPELAFTDAKFAATPDAAEPLDLREIIAYSHNLERVLRPSHPPELASHFAAKAAAPNEIEAMVRDVQAREAEFAPPPESPKKRPMKSRLKFVLAIAAVGNPCIAAIPVIYDAFGDPWSMAILTGWFMALNLGLVILYFTLPNE